MFRDREEREAGAEVIRFQEAGDNTDTDEDEITDYIGSVEVHSVGSSDSPASQVRPTSMCICPYRYFIHFIIVLVTV